MTNLDRREEIKLSRKFESRAGGGRVPYMGVDLASIMISGGFGVLGA